MRNTADDTRGVSEVIGFVLVFSLVVGTISIVYVGGLAGLNDTRDAERVNNAQRAFDVMANNFQQMGRGDAPNRATEIKLAEAQLSTTTNRKVSVDADELSGAVGANPVAIRYYTEGDTSLYYENGAVIRVDDGDAIMQQEPDFLFSSDKIVIRFISLRGAGQAVGGTSTTVLVRAERKQRDVLVNRGSTTNNVEISIQTHPDRIDVWEGYLTEHLNEATGSASCSPPTRITSETTEVSCTGGSVTTLAVSRIKVDVTLA